MMLNLTPNQKNVARRKPQGGIKDGLSGRPDETFL